MTRKVQWKTMKCLEQDKELYSNLQVVIDGLIYSIQELVLQTYQERLTKEVKCIGVDTMVDLR